MKLFFYIIYIVFLLIELLFLNKKMNLKYNDFSINNFGIYVECIFINLSSLLFWNNNFSFSVYLVAIIMIYLYYLKKDLKDITDEDKRVVETFKHFVKHFIFILLINIPIYFISNLKIIGYTFFSIVFILVIILADTLLSIKKKEGYKVMSQEEIFKLFPNYDINNLYNSLYNTYVFIKNNYMNSRNNLNKDYLSNELFNEYDLKEKNNIAKSQKEIYEEFLYVSASLVEYKKDTNSFKVELVLSYKDYVIDLNGRVLEGTPQFPHRYTYLIDFKYTDKVIIENEKLIKSI